MTSKYLPFLLSLSLSVPALAQQQNVVESSDASLGMAQLQAVSQNENSELRKLGEKIIAATQTSGFSSKVEEEISKYRVRLTVDPFGNVFGSDNLDGSIYYQYVVEPAFRNNEQMRKDIWVLNLRGKASVISGGTQVRITFSRTFGGPDAKRKAAFASVKGFWEAPLNTNDIKTKMKVGEGYRFEVAGDVALGVSDDLDKVGSKGSAFIHYKRGGQLIVDLFRVSEQSVRGRFIGLKNRGEIGAGLEFKYMDFFGSAPGKLKELVSIGFGVGARMSIASLRNPLSLDTLMVDNIFKFDSDKPRNKEQAKNDRSSGEAALDEILTNMKRGELARIFLLFTEDGDLMKALREKMQISEDIAKEDLQNYRKGKSKFTDLRVYNFFKGRMVSHLRMGEIHAKLSGLAGGKSQSGKITSHVAAYDENENAQYYWLDNSFIYHSGRTLFGRNKYNLNHDLDVLVKSDKNQGIGALSDVVVRTQIEDTMVPADEVDQYKKIILGSLPGDHQNSVAVKAALGSGKKTNAFLSTRYSYGEAAFKSVGRLDRPRVTMKLIEYFENHPNRKFMNLPTDGPGEVSSIGLGTYSEQKAHDIAKIFEPSTTNKENMEAFNIAKRDPVFERFLVSEFFGRILPQEKPEPYFSFDMKVSSAEEGTKVLHLGENKISPIYDAVSFMRTIINDQSLDMQMTSSHDYSGNPILVPADQMNFSKSLIKMDITD